MSMPIPPARQGCGSLALAVGKSTSSAETHARNPPEGPAGGGGTSPAIRCRCGSNAEADLENHSQLAILIDLLKELP
jgi:hypothetical protein